MLLKLIPYDGGQGAAVRGEYAALQGYVGSVHISGATMKV